MAPVRFSVSQIRVAASCPRILYFDADHTRRQGLQSPSVTRIWKMLDGNEITACGTLFHATIEKFNQAAATDPAVRETIRSTEGSVAIQQGLFTLIYWKHLDRDALFKKKGPEQLAFMTAMRVYVAELADILSFAFKLGKPTDEILDEMFGDRRRRVNTTFDVGRDGEPVQITGILDYVFYDWRTERTRIIDYKLTPAHAPSNDLFQVCVYALMHHLEHKTEPDVAVLYLHPTRQMIEKKWEDVWAEREKVWNLVASMREWARFDERTGQGLKPPGEPFYCISCKWDDECVRRLGPKEEGRRISLSQDAAIVSSTSTQPIAEPISVPSETTAGIPTGELWIGRTVEGGRLVSLPCNVLPTHVTVVGAAGSGKTWFAKVLVEEAILQGVPVLAIDPQGDLVQFLRCGDQTAFNEEERERLRRFRQFVEPRILTPGSSHGIRVSLSPIRMPAAAELMGEPDAQRQAEVLEGLLGTVANNLVSIARCGGEIDSQQTFVLQVLKWLTAGASPRSLQLAEIAAAIANPDTLGIDDAGVFIKKAEREKLARKLNNLVHGPAAHLFTGGRGLDMEELCRPIEAGKIPLNVIYLNALADDDQKQFFVAALAAEVYRWMVTTTQVIGKPNLLLYLDEARDYIPAGASKPAAKAPLIRLFAQGRKYGVACLMCTQSPRSVDYNVFGNCSTKMIGRLEAAQDAERVAEWFAQQGPAPTWLRARAGAEPGTFVGRWPQMAAELEGQTIKSRSLFSLHEGAWSPDRVQAEMRGDPVREAFQMRPALPR